MDSSTITFIATLVIAFIFLRWFITSDEEDEAQSQLSSAANLEGDSTQAQQERPAEVRYRRPVNDSMIEVVQQLAPTLTVGQIRLDLQRSGSVQETIDRFLSEGTLPYPPSEGPNAAATHADESGDSRNQVDNIKAENLLKKYGIDESKATAIASGSEKAGWSDSAEDRASTLQQKKVEMILKARKRLESQLMNEQDLSGLAEK